jgi:DNA-binding transcriptional LysR family regulator
LREADSAVQDHYKAPAGELRVTAPVTFAHHHIAPALAGLLECHPRVSVYLSPTDHCESLWMHVFIEFLTSRYRGQGIRSPEQLTA